MTLNNLVGSTGNLDITKNGRSDAVYGENYEKGKNYKGWLGNVKWNDGGTFRGRGFKQMTGRANYAEYWSFRGWLARNAYKDNWWKTPKWWDIEGDYINSQHQNFLPTQDNVKLAQLTAEMRPPEILQPERVQTEASVCIDTAGWFWAKNQLINIADNDDSIRMTNRVRGDSATNASDFPAAAHYTQRLEHTNRIKTLIGE
jgi:hydroxyethylthiazole kinase